MPKKRVRRSKPPPTLRERTEAVVRASRTDLGRSYRSHYYAPRRGQVACISTDITARKQAEETLRQSEERYRTLFNTLIEGFCIIEMVFNARDRPVDYRFLEVNLAFAKQTGWHHAQGRLMRDLAPDHEARWLEIYGKVAVTGEPARFVNEARALDRWYEVSAFRFTVAELCTAGRRALHSRPAHAPTAHAA